MWLKPTYCARLLHTSKPLLRQSQFDAAALRRSGLLEIHPEVEEALASKKPVVALETALVTHGFPFPHNYDLAASLEDIVRKQGAIPATIGLLNGRVKIGMERHELEQLATLKGNPAKISRRDIGPAIAAKSHGGTTCSATLVFSALAGIKIFATGGLGGVHRGGENSMDVSADLQELARCPVGLISAGVKSILDIGRTLEYLETLGVPVLPYNSTKEFPAFFSQRSGFYTPWSVETPSMAAQALHAQWKMGLNNGAVIAVPIPAQYEEEGLKIQKAVDQAVADSEANGMSKKGKDVTPWLLNRIKEITGGASLGNNIALLENTALVGGQIAVEYQKLENEVSEPDTIYPSAAPTALSRQQELPPKPKAENLVSGFSTFPETKTESNVKPTADLMVIGSAAVDITAQFQNVSDVANNSTSSGTVTMTLGGVARNIAEASHRILSVGEGSEASSMLVAPVGDDAFGRMLKDELAQTGMRTDGLVKSTHRTALCNMVLNSSGNLVGGVADMDITTAMASTDVIPYFQKHRPRLVALDGNLAPALIKDLTLYSNKNGISVFFEPTSLAKSTRILPAVAASLGMAGHQAPIQYISPNIIELLQIYREADSGPFQLTSHPTWWKVVDGLGLGSAFRNDLERLARMNVSQEDTSKGTLAFLVENGLVQTAVKLLPFFQHLVIKCGEKGAVVVMRVPLDSPWNNTLGDDQSRRIVTLGCNEFTIVQHFPPSPLPREGPINVTGAGDTFVGALLATLQKRPEVFRDPKKLGHAMRIAQDAAILTLSSDKAVSPALRDVANRLGLP